MEYVVFWFLAAWILKKMDDKRRTYMSERKYRQLQKEQDEKDGLKEKLLVDRSHEVR